MMSTQSTPDPDEGHQVDGYRGQGTTPDSLLPGDTHPRSTPPWCTTKCLAEDEFASRVIVEKG